MRFRTVTAVVLLLLVCSSFGLPLPSAVLEPNPLKNQWGNMRSAEALADIKMFESALLKDPPGAYYPWKRQVLMVSKYGAISGDGKDDWVGLHAACNAACILSATIMANYTAMIANNPKMQRLPSGPEDRPVLVELRWDKNGVYDLGQGIWYADQTCNYVLYNGQNSTVVVHKESGWPQINWGVGNGYWWDSASFTPCGTPGICYIYSFNIINSAPCTTLGRITNLVYSGNTVSAVDLVAVGPSIAFDESVITFQTVDRGGFWNFYQLPIAVYGGYVGGSVSSSQPGLVGGTMRLTLGSDQNNVVLAQQVAVGQYIGIARRSTLGLDNAAVVLSVNFNELGSNVNLGPWNVDIVDVHRDRLQNMPFIFGGIEGPLGQTRTGGRLRIWHSSWEGGSDDSIDTMAGCGDVISLDTTNKAIQLQIVSKGSAGPCPIPGKRISIGRYPNPFMYIDTAIVLSCNTTGSSSWAYLDRMPNVQVGDVYFNTDDNPTFLHVKNFRGGNHHYNLLNIKGSTLLVEKSYFYNTSMNAIAAGCDLDVWYEGNPVQNMTIVNNVFYNNYLVVNYGPADKNGLTPEATQTAVFSGNTIYFNASTVFWGRSQPLAFMSIGNLEITKNTIYTTPGMSQNLPLIAVCSIKSGSISGNQIKQSKYIPGYGGQLCVGTKCPVFPQSMMMGYYDDCNLGIGNLQFSNNTFPALHSL